MAAHRWIAATRRPRTRDSNPIEFRHQLLALAMARLRPMRRRRQLIAAVCPIAFNAHPAPLRVRTSGRPYELSRVIMPVAWERRFATRSGRAATPACGSHGEGLVRGKIQAHVIVAAG